MPITFVQVAAASWVLVRVKLANALATSIRVALSECLTITSICVLSTTPLALVRTRRWRRLALLLAGTDTTRTVRSRLFAVSVPAGNP